LQVTAPGEAARSGTPYIVMEFLEGKDLAAHLASARKLGELEAVGVILEVCEALAEAHEKGLVHRDLKPANLVWAERGDGSKTIKVLDFGIAKSVAAETSHASLTSSGGGGAPVVLGTPRYMSPEQARGAGNVDARTDIWAIGLVLHELLTGQPVFDGQS